MSTVPNIPDPLDLAFCLLCVLRGEPLFRVAAEDAAAAGLLVKADDGYGLTETGLRHYLAHREALAADCVREGYEDEIP